MMVSAICYANHRLSFRAFVGGSQAQRLLPSVRCSSYCGASGLFGGDTGNTLSFELKRYSGLISGPQSTALNKRHFSTNSLDAHGQHHLPKNEQVRHKLNIGFTSLSTSMPFSPQSPSDDDGSSHLDTRASIMLTALRGGVCAMDCPPPPLIDAKSGKFDPAGSKSSADGDGSEDAPCWIANRQSEVQIADSFDQAWQALLEEDDGEATRAENSTMTLTTRLGYRSAVVLSEGDDHAAKIVHNDCREKEGAFPGDARLGLLYPGKESEESDDDDEGVNSEGKKFSEPPVALVHNLSEEYVLHSLRTSPLVQRYKVNNTEVNDDSLPKKRMKIISLAHNPETQTAAHLLLHSSSSETKSTQLQKAQAFMKQSLKSAFIGYEHAVLQGYIDGFGVCSNGFSLPSDHDMFLSWRDVLECAVDAYLEVHHNEKDDGVKNNEVRRKRSSLQCIRLPGNVLETRGLDVAHEICTFFRSCEDGGDNVPGTKSSSEEGLPSFTDNPNDHHVIQRRKLRKLRNLLPKKLEVYATRPLTAYPHGGTGWEPSSPPGLTESSGRSSGVLLSAPPLFLKGKEDESGDSRSGGGSTIDATHPIKIMDYQIESGPVGQPPYLSWTNYHYNNHGPRPSMYQPILNAALSHFDATSILEISRERALTAEERETLDGCKLLRDMIHDLDASLDKMKSFADYEEYLLNVAVPLLYGSFEELDEESAGILQAFFRVHGMAVRMVVARWTRELLLGGLKGVNSSELSKEHEMERKKDKQQEKKIAKIWKSLGLGEFCGGYDIPEDITLQEFALKHLLEAKQLEGVVVGCSRPEHVLEAMRAADSSCRDEDKSKHSES